MKKRNIVAPTQLLNEGPGPYDEGYNQGYNLGYDKGHNTGYQKGNYDGGDAFVDQLLPEATILPGVPIEQIIARGLEAMQESFYKIMATEETMQLILDALQSKSPLSLVRLGDGELLTMAQDTVRSTAQVKEAGHFLEYAGVKVPDLGIRDLLVQSVKEATIVGVPLLRVPNYQNLAFEVFQAYGIDYKQLQLTHSTINYAIYMEHRLPDLLTGRKVLTIGNKAEGLAGVFQAAGIAAESIAPVSGMQDIDRVLENAAQREFDIAIISAGIPSVVLAQQIAARFGKVALDFGHLADSMVKGETPYA